MGRVFNFRSGCMCHTMHLRPGVAKQPNLELKTRPKQLLGSLPLVIALPVLRQKCQRQQYATVTIVLPLATFGSATQIGSFLFLSFGQGNKEGNISGIIAGIITLNSYNVNTA